MAFHFQLDTAPLRPLWQKVPEKLRRPFMGRLGKRAEVELRQHFRARDTEPNKRGWPKQHFWSRLRRVTALSSWTDREAIITVADPALAAKIHGAVIRPVEAKALAIPIHRRAYGVRPSSGLIPGLFVLRTKKGAYLATSEYQTRSGRKASTKQALRAKYGGYKRQPSKIAFRQKITIYYKLVKSTMVPADPRALPEHVGWMYALMQEAERYIERALATTN